jgi:hypothetical protein
MSIFSFPRIHFKGLLTINVGTGNNDDYSGSSYNGQPLRLADSIFVQPITFGMDDATFLAWAQKSQPVGQPSVPNARTSFMNKGSGTSQQQYVIPGEWNYYGDMGMTMQGMNAITVQTAPTTFVPSHPFIGAQLSFNNRPGPTGRSTGMLIDINPEGVPCSQVFADFLTLTGNDGNAIFTGKPSKAVTRWINFQKNSRLRGPNGAGAYFHCVVPIAAIQGQPIVPFMSPAGSPPLAGIVFRYYMSRSLQKINSLKYADAEWRAQIEALYAKGQSGKANYADFINPTYVQLNGTITPWYAGEMQSAPTGRLLAPTTKTFPVPPPPPGESGGNGPAFGLAPAVFQVNNINNVPTVSVDFLSTFPDQYQKNAADPYNPLQTNNNPTMDFGPVNLILDVGGKEKTRQLVPYPDTTQGDNKGWLFEVPLTGVTPDEAKQGSFRLNSDKYGDLLVETDFLIASDQSNICGEQNGSATMFMNDGTSVGPATIRVFQKGQELSPSTCPPITVWQYAQVPNQDQSNFKAVKLMTGYKPGAQLQVNTSQPGVFLFTFTLPNDPPPPGDAADVDLMNSPMINLRLLPNNKDYSQYYVKPNEPDPVGNDKLTFDVIYQEVLRNYYLLYPGMSAVIPLNDPEQWDDAEMAGRLLQHTQKSWWNQYGYMPRTRDLSQSRRTLLHAWARKYLQP